MSPADDLHVKHGDVLMIVAPRQLTEKLKILIGEESRLNLQEIPGNLLKKRIVVTHKRATYKKLEDIKELNNDDCTITRIERSGFELVTAPDFVLHIGDVVTVVGTEEGIKAITLFLGNSIKELEKPQLAPVFFGLFLGIILGTVPLAIPGIPVPVKIGLAGGPLIIALIISQFGNLAGMYNYTTYSANLMVRELGIVLFLASIGLSTGSDFVAIFKTGKGLEWMGIGVVITTVPLLIAAFAARYIAKKSFFEICGLLSGASTDPPALAFALQLAGNNIPSLTYATVYPLTMIARILAAELLILGFI
jgi:putative transport protein